MEQDLERVRLIVSDVLDVETGRISPDSAQGDIPEWDSLAQLRIVTALEQEFGVKPTMREIPELNSIPAITRYLDSAAAH
jgi:acyl carrier protein